VRSLFQTAIEHQRPGVPRHRRLRPGPVGPRSRGHPGRGSRLRGDAAEVDGQPGVRGDHDEFDAWKKRDLSDIALEYLFLAGSHFRYHDGARAEPVLAAWGMSTEGRPVLVGLEPGASESTDAWSGFLDGMVTRGLRPPLLVISDGAPGLIAAVELVFAHSLRQRCLIHRARHVLTKVPVEHQGEVKKACWELFDDSGTEPGDGAIAVVRGRAERFAATYTKRFPGRRRLPHGLLREPHHLPALPAGHHARIRHSNFIERPFGDTRRRVKVIGRLPDERTCLGLVWAVLDRASRGWRGVVMTPVAVRQLQHLRRQLFSPTSVEEVPKESSEAVTAAA
jgi:putative transposase